MESKKRNYKLTPLNIFSGLVLLWCIGNTVFNYGQLSEGEGWGVVYMIGIAGFGLVILLLDLIIQKSIKNKKAGIIAGIIVLVIAIFLLSK